MTDAPPSPSSTAYLIVDSGSPNLLNFLGGEFDCSWDPPNACLSVGGVFFTTGLDCSYLNRGTCVPVITNLPGKLHCLWVNTIGNAVCSKGVAARIVFDTSLCVGGGCISLNSFLCLDLLHRADGAVITNAILTIGGGGGHHCGITPVEPSTWGRVKELYRS